MRLFGLNISWGKTQQEQNSSSRSAQGAFEWPWGNLNAPYQSMNGADMFVSQETALSVPAIWSAVNVVANTLAALPFDLYDKTDAGAELAISHPLYYLTKTEPDDYVTGFEFRRNLFVDACFGNAYARIYRNGIGRPYKFEYIPRRRVMPYKDTQGRRFYFVTMQDGSVATLHPHEILHIKGISLDGWIGEDVTVRHSTSISTSIAADKYGNYFFGNGANPSGVIGYPGVLSAAQRSILEDNFNRRNAGVTNVGKNLVIDGGMTYTKIGQTPEEAMLNETRNFQVNESARIFGVPAHLLQQLDRATFNNIETMNIQFVVLCLKPWAVQFEQEMHIKTLTKAEKTNSGYFYRLNLTGLLRGDTNARTEMYASGILNGWLTRNEARTMEDLNIIDGLDSPLMQANMSIIDESGNVKMPETPDNQNAQDQTQINTTDAQQPQASK
jgi:HK97 family phage portal protein